MESLAYFVCWHNWDNGGGNYVYHAGAPLTIFCIEPDGNLTLKKLGLNIDKGEQPQVLVPAGTIFGAALDGHGTYNLACCLVSPGFDFADFELFKREDLLKQYPAYEKNH